jgi:hypothetical protein
MERHNMYKLEHNINTGEIVEIPLTQEEIDMMNNDHQKFKQIHEEKMESKQTLLERLGITEEEARLLLS